MKLLSDRILIRKNSVKEKTASGIFVPEKLSNKNEGTVVLVGDKAKHVSIGQVVKYKNKAGTPIEYNGEMCLLLRDGSESSCEIELILN